MTTLYEAVLGRAPVAQSLADAVFGPQAGPPFRSLAEAVFGENASEHGEDPTEAQHQTPAAVKRALQQLAHSQVERGQPIPRGYHFSIGLIRKFFEPTLNRAAQAASRRTGANADEVLSHTANDPYRWIDLAKRLAHHEYAPAERIVSHATALLHNSAHQRAIELRRAETAAKRGGLQRTQLSLDQPVGAGERPAGETVGADLRHAHSERGPGGKYLPVERAAHVAGKIADSVRASPQEKQFIQVWIAGMLSGDPDVSKDSYRRAIGASSSRVASTAIDKLRARWKSPREFSDMLQGLGVDEARKVTLALVEAMLALTPDRLVVEQAQLLLQQLDLG